MQHFSMKRIVTLLVSPCCNPIHLKPVFISENRAGRYKVYAVDLVLAVPDRSYTNLFQSLVQLFDFFAGLYH